MKDTWISIESTHETPDGEVLAINKYNFSIVGYLIITTRTCESEDHDLENVTHWQPIVPPERT